jgi:PRTRC genetic system protein F
MQLNHAEMGVLHDAMPPQQFPSLFHIPTLHASVPRTAKLLRYETNFLEFARLLVDAGIVIADQLPDDVATPGQVVQEGLRAWFQPRIGGLQHMRFDVSVIDIATANTSFGDGQMGWTCTQGPVVTIVGSTTDLRYVEDIARAVEKQVPGLFLCAYTELIKASYRTIDIQSPEEVLENETAYSLWDTDLGSVTNVEAREALQDRFGDDDEINLDDYMPKAIAEAYGNGFCFSYTPEGEARKKVEKFSNNKLKKLGRSGNQAVASIANGLLALRKAAQRVERLGARFTLPDGFEGRALYRASLLMFNDDVRCSHYRDQEGQYLWENGEGTDLHALEELPATADALKYSFQKFDALFDLIATMDALIPIISYSSDAE